MQKNLLIYKESNQYKIAVLIEENDQKYAVENELGKKQNLGREKLILLSDQKKERPLAAYRSEAEKIALTFDLKEFYDVVRELGESFSLEELSELYFSENHSFVELLAMVLKLSEDPIYFQLEQQRVLVRSEEEIAAAIEKVRKKESEILNQQKEREEAIQWIVAHKEGNEGEVPLAVEQFLLPLKELIVHGEEGFSKKKEVYERIEQLCSITGSECKIDKTVWCFQFLEKLNLFRQDDEFTKRKFHLKVTFPSLTEEELAEVTISDGAKREDLTMLQTFTVDEEETKDIDDGLSFEKTEHGFRFFIHIADPDAFIRKGSLLDREAFARGTSIYLTTERIHMFPPQVTERCFNLTQGEVRPAVTLIITTNSEYQIEKKEFVLSMIQVKQRLSYDFIDEVLKESGEETGKEGFRRFSQFALSCQKKRVTDGAYLIEQPDLKVNVEEGGKVSVEIRDSNSLSHILVREMMILFNKTIAEYMITHRQNSIFISQNAPDSDLSSSEKMKQEGFTRYELIQLLITLKKSVIGTTPGPHFCMGLAYYTQATSPIRRYLDLTVHRILKHALQPEVGTLMDEDEIKMIVATVSAKSLTAATCERESERFWLLRYFEQNKEETYRVLITKKITGGFLGELEGYGLRVPVFGKAQLKLGSYLSVKLKKIQPITGEVRAECLP